MRYLGGKARIAKCIVEQIEKHRQGPDQLYVEPFVGGCNVLPRVSGPRWGNDALPDLKLLYEAVRDGWVPPLEVSREEHATQKNAEPSAYRAFVGIGASYGGKWFGGYYENKSYQPKSKFDNNYSANASNVLSKRVAPKIQGVRFTDLSYDQMDIPPGSIVYCDPPYTGTTGYKGLPPFDSQAFWRWATELSKTCTVLVSEYQAPDDWDCIWQRERNLGISGLTGVKTKGEERIEKLFKHKG